MTKKIKKYKVGIDSETYAISLVEAPAIESDFVALAKQEEEKKQVLLEKDEKHLVVGAALIPNLDIYRYDGENEYYINFTKESIEKMSQDFMKEYRQNEITLDHEDYATEITVVESWLVVDSYKDKSNALGINVPEGTWMVAMKVNNIETWDRIKNGELKGFSVESMISLEEFSKQKQNNMEMTNEQEMNLFEKFKKWLTSAKDEALEANPQVKEKVAEAIKNDELPISAATDPMNFEEQPTVEPTPTVEPQTEPQNEPSEPSELAVEPTVEPTQTVEPEPTVEPTQTEPKEDNSQLVELINSLKAEIDALKETNNGLAEKVKEMGKQPSAQPVNTNAKNVGGVGDNYASWREQMRNMVR